MKNTFSENKKSARNYTAFMAVALALFFSIFFSEKAFASCIPFTATADTIALYHLDGNGTDATGLLGDLVFTGGTSSVSGICGSGAVGFNGTNANAGVPSINYLPHGSTTLITSVKFNSNPSIGNLGIFQKEGHHDSGSGSEEYLFQYNIGGTQWIYAEHSNGSITTDLTYQHDFNDGQWHNFITSFNQDTQAYFLMIDGVVVASSTTHNQNGATQGLFSIGSNEGNNSFTNASIDENIIFRTALTETEAYDYYNNFFLGNGGGTSPSVSFVAPINGSTSWDFSNWVLNVTGEAGSIGTVYVYYATNDGSVYFPPDSGSIAGEIISPMVITKRNSLYGNFSTSTWRAFAVLRDPYGVFVASSSNIYFTISTSRKAQPPTNSTTSLSQPKNPKFNNPASSTQSTSTQELFGFQDDAFYFIQNQWLKFKNVFPFSVVFGFASTTEDAIRNSSSSGANYDLYIESNIVGFPVRFPVLTSSTMEFVVGSSTKNIIFGVERKILWLGGSAFILFTIL